jgi:iron complex outermembrane recepter protein
MKKEHSVRKMQYGKGPPQTDLPSVFETFFCDTRLRGLILIKKIRGKRKSTYQITGKNSNKHLKAGKTIAQIVTEKCTWQGGKCFAPILFFFLRRNVLLFFLISSSFAYGQVEDSLLTLTKLKGLSLQELLNVEVTSVSLRPEKLFEVPSAIQVIRNSDIRRSGATRLPEALRLASNLQIAQTNSHSWAITARGFNGLPSAGGILANKLLVMIDGRSIYNPLLGGVYWDVQNTPLKDVDRIEVVSGPGGTQWGANAVNGVVNVVTKSAKETQGLYVSGATGSLINDYSVIRIGGRSKVDSNLYFRMYLQHFDQENTILSRGSDAKDGWNFLQGGFRMDYFPSQKSTLTLQGDIYEGESNKDSVIRFTSTEGQNLLARFSHVFNENCDLKIQIFYDHTWRRTPRSIQPFFYDLSTLDLDVQHRFDLGSRQNILYGFGYRMQMDATAINFQPLKRDMPLYNVFFQDEIALIPKMLKVTVGSKVSHNVFTGYEFQPGIRLGYTPNSNNTLWSAVSRSVRIPTRFDHDFTVTDVKFKSEKLMAYELGYRVRPTPKLSLSIATFFNHYDDLRSLDTYPDSLFPIIIGNSQKAESWGMELSGNYQIFTRWHLRGGYTYFDRSIWAISSAVIPISKEFESVDPRNIFMLQSMVDISKNLSIDAVGRYVDVLPAATTIVTVPAYFTFDLRIAIHLKPFEFSIVGQNLLQEDQVETGNIRIPRSVYAKIRCHF